MNWLTVAEAAKHSRLSPDTIRRLIVRGAIAKLIPKNRRGGVHDRTA